MMLITFIAILAVLIVAGVSLPLLKAGRTTAAGMLGVFVIGGSVGLYLVIGSPGLAVAPQTGQVDQAGQGGQVGDIEQMVRKLAERLERQPNDQEGWIMLGRSYVLMGRYSEAADAFQKAISLSGSDSGSGAVNLRASYAEARALEDPASLAGETGRLFEAVLDADPSNPRGLWYGGLAAAQQGNGELAAERWQSLLKQPDLPPQFRQVVEGRLAELDPSLVGALVKVAVAVPDNASPPASAVLFVFIRDPAKPGPPLAARRVNYNRLPVTVNITAGDLISSDNLPDGAVEVGAILTESGNPSDATWRGAQQWHPDSGDIVQVVLQPIAGESAGRD